MDCNNEKMEYYDKFEFFVHPYFDNKIGDVYEFLRCEIIENQSIGFRFYIEKLSHWDDTVYKKVNYHFTKLKIFDLYTADFIADFAIIFEELSGLFSEGLDISAIRLVLDRKVNSLLRAKIKPWEYVGFKSLLENTWFFDTYLPSFQIKTVFPPFALNQSTDNRQA